MYLTTVYAYGKQLAGGTFRARIVVATYWCLGLAELIRPEQ